MLGVVPKGVEVNRRVATGRTVYVLINFSADVLTVTLPRAMQDLLQGSDATQLTLNQYGVAILQDKAK